MFIIIETDNGKPMLLNMNHITSVMLDGTYFKLIIGEEILRVCFRSEHFAKLAFETVIDAVERGGERVVIDLTGHQ